MVSETRVNLLLVMTVNVFDSSWLVVRFDWNCVKIENIVDRMVGDHISGIIIVSEP